MIQTKDFPPQAYTKETISEAFIWLQSQPDEIKKKATHTHQLVSLYLKDKSQQYWASQTNTSVSNTNFNDRLQEMAVDVKEKEKPEASLSHASHSNGSYNSQPDTLQYHNSDSTPSKAPLQFTSGQNHHTRLTLEQILDPKSLRTIQNITTQLNLSSDLEATRLLIALGSEKIKSFLPETQTPLKKN